MQRVMIIGAPGSGKSTLSRDLGARLGLPVYHTDMMTWAENWVERSDAVRQAMAVEVAAKESWVFEGGMSGTYPNRLARAEVLIWLDLPVMLRLWRVTKSMIQNRGQNRPDLPKGCTETLNAEWLGFLHYIWKTRKPHRDRIARMVAEHDGAAEVVHLQSSKAIAAYLAEI